MYECLVRNHNVSPIQKLSFSDAIQKAREKKHNAGQASKKRSSDDGKAEDAAVAEAISTMLVSRTPHETRGHTSYLTFATFLPAIENNVTLSAEEMEVDEETPATPTA